MPKASCRTPQINKFQSIGEKKKIEEKKYRKESV